jgi:hypothetical protein
MFIESMLNSSLIKRSVMYKLFLGLMVVALFVGCSSKEEKALLKSYTQKIDYHKHLQQTEKAELFDGDSSMAILTATYIYSPSFEKNDTREEVFIVGVQFENPEDSKMIFNKNKSTHTNEYTLTLRGKKANKVVHLSENDKRLDGLSFITDWGEYYEVTYPHTGKRFTLVFKNAKYGTSTLNFAKVAKFVYTKKGF